MAICGEEGCEGKAVALGLCSKHYQRKQRGSTRDKPGPAPQYPRKPGQKHRGAPRITVSLEPELLAWVQEQGGAAWVRFVLERLRAVASRPNVVLRWEDFRR